jgi:hypothetical protein
MMWKINMSCFRTVLVSASVLLALVSFNPTRATAAGSCDPVFNALTKVVSTPSHSYSTHTTLSPKGSKPTNAEIIYLPSKSYMRINGNWMENPISQSEILQQEQETRKKGKATCQLMRNESVNGESATLYSLHSESENSKEDGQIWISTHTGLPLREEMDMEITDGGGKNHLSARYEYGNVKPPM